ncbi:unnamed protein product [Vitrella brassicaformis CCMP3155]|uniref:Nucleolar complex-associated protein 3 N-terminal domain-containing protein n=3 Tax=Vitrella brassicaformis TaxID=1169539 RepID=A0A0G4EDY6_VITBC|nr:unnamed protein product [Vitrella brassicaformis CCMP3155]|eukprot:CEL93775.1 unnamed protein product [Vitrella brassicaformis CCMP3155]
MGRFSNAFMESASPGIRKRRRRSDHADEQSEEGFERAPRVQKKWLEEERRLTRLPLKQEDGIAAAAKEPSADHDIDKDNESSPLSKKQQKRLERLRKEAEEAMARKAKAKSAQQAADKKDDIDVLVNKLQTAEQKKLEIARVSNAILASPEKELPRLEVLFRLFHREKVPALKQVALVSIGLVLKDILPAYRVQMRGEENDSKPGHQALSRAVEKLQTHEKTMVRFSQQFIDILRHSPPPPRTAASLVSELLTANPSFNWTDDLIDLCVKYAGKPDPPVQLPAIDALSWVMQHDPSLDLTASIVKAMGRLAKVGMSSSTGGKRSGLSKALLDAIARLDLRRKQMAAERESHAVGADDEGIDEDLRRDLMIGSVHGDLKRFRKNEALVLEQLFVLYLRVLRSPHMYPDEVVSGCLRGLGCHSHFINVELMNEIFTELKRLISEGEGATASAEVGLRAVAAALLLLQGVGAAIQIEVSWVVDGFCRILRLALPHLSTPSYDPISTPPNAPASFLAAAPLHQEDETLTADPDAPAVFAVSTSLGRELIESIDLMVRCPQIVGGGGMGTGGTSMSLLRVVEGIMDVALHCDSAVSAGLCERVKLMLLKMPRLKSMVDPDGAVISSLSGGVSVYWHLQALLVHGHPSVRRAAADLLTLSSEADIREAAKEAVARTATRSWSKSDGDALMVDMQDLVLCEEEKVLTRTMGMAAVPRALAGGVVGSGRRGGGVAKRLLAVEPPEWDGDLTTDT